MDNTQQYGEILTKVLRRVAAAQPSLQRFKIRAVCDREAHQFLIIGTGWEQSKWSNVILFHAWLQEGKVVVEEDNFESTVAELVEAGIAETDVVASEELAEELLQVA